MYKPTTKDLALLLKGGGIGIANIIPGVSGGTMAVVFGIYEELVGSISQIFRRGGDKKKALLFLIELAIGAGAGIFLFSKAISFALANYEALTMLFFMGLILGSLPYISSSHEKTHITLSDMTFLMIGILLVLFLGSGEGGDVEQKQAGEAVALSAAPAFQLFIAGIFAGGAMIIPGVSGSFILLVMGQYQTIIHAVENLEIGTLLIVMAGVGVGIVVFAKAINYALKHAAKATHYFILGLIGASFIVLYSGIPSGLWNAVLAVVLFFLGTLISFKVAAVPEPERAAPGQS